MNRYYILVYFMVFTTQSFSQVCTARMKAQDFAVIAGAEQKELFLPMMSNKRIGIVANQTSVVGNEHLVDVLLREGIAVKKIFAPEHGFRGMVGAGEGINNTRDPQTGVPIVSLYGSKNKPSAKDLLNIDLMVFDIQDVGVRFFTYISTLHYVMESCGENHVPLLILDRPNPLGFYIDGPLPDRSFQSFVGMHPIPVVYGMTIGELAEMINGEGWLANGIKCPLTVITCKNYSHKVFYHLPVNPSPNLTSMEAVYLYPSLCFFEGTVMSIGRGTATPFRVIGHPGYPEKHFYFTPQVNQANKNPLFLYKKCFGIDLRSIPEADIHMNHLQINWLIDVYKNMNLHDAFFSAYFDKLAGSDQLRKQIIDGWTEDQIRLSWKKNLVQYRQTRKKYLLYDDFE